MNMQQLVKAAGAVFPVIRNNGRNLELSFYGRKATYWPGKAVVLRNPIDGRFLAIRSK